MAALTAARDTLQKGVSFEDHDDVQVADSTTIFQGAMVCIDAAGKAIECAVATTLKGAGRAEATVVAGASNTLKVPLKSGIFKWALDGTNPPVQGDVGELAYATDDQTISNNATGNSAVGRIHQVDSDGVWVSMHKDLIPNG